MSFDTHQPINTATLFFSRSQSPAWEHLHAPIPATEKAAWQETLDSLAGLMKGFALVVRQDAEGAQVLFASHNAPPAYASGQAQARDSYGASILSSQNALSIADARRDPAWSENADVQQGMVACLGEPLRNADASCFAALLVLNTQARPLDETQSLLLKQFRYLLEARLTRYVYAAQLNFFSKFPETNPNIVLQINQHGEIVYLNPVAWRWLEDFDFAGNVDALRRLFPADFEFTASAMPRTQEITYAHYHYLFKATIFPNTTDFFITIIDVSERVRLDKSKRDIERMMLHDLKTPLNHIINLADYLLTSTQPSLPAAFVKDAEIIRQAGQDMDALIVHSLDLYKMEQGTYQLQLDALDLLRVFKEVTRTLHLNDKPQLELSLQLNGHTVDLQQATHSFMVTGEYRLFKMAYMNLIKNAYEAAPDNLRLHIDICGTQQAFSIVLTNNAVIPAAIRRVFFDKYSTADKPGGTGLGTYSAWLAVRTLGGDIDFDTSDERGETRLIAHFKQPQAVT